MRLAAFISENTESILVEWEAFARTIWPPPAPGMPLDPVELRNSAADILAAVVADMGTLQDARQEAEKSAGRGLHGPESDRLDHASQVHGAARVGSGLALPTVVAEYRALRASVLRLWRNSRPDPDVHDLDDVTRFNEAVDQSLALAIASYTHRVDTARTMFLGILGHDLRNPLNAIILTATEAQLAGGEPAQFAGQLRQIIDSANTIATLTRDLIDFTSSSMGAQLPLSPAHADLHVLCQEVLREMRAVHPTQPVSLAVQGDLNGTWDAHRMRQVLANLLANALHHGAAERRVELGVDGTSGESVVLTVHNEGEPIPANVLPTIFDPLVRAPGQQPRRPGCIGLGLYIVREIVSAHGGTADIASSAASGTTVTIRLPRHTPK